MEIRKIQLSDTLSRENVRLVGSNGDSFLIVKLFIFNGFYKNLKCLSSAKLRYEGQYPSHFLEIFFLSLKSNNSRIGFLLYL